MDCNEQRGVAMLLLMLKMFVMMMMIAMKLLPSDWSERVNASPLKHVVTSLLLHL